MCQAHDQKVASSNPSRSRGRIFFSRVNFVCWLLFGVCSIPMLPQWHVKDPSHSAKSAGGRLHLNMHKPLTKRSQSGLTMPLSRHIVGTYPETSSHATCWGNIQPWSSQSRLAEPLWTDPGIKSGISVWANLHSPSPCPPPPKKVQAGNEQSNILLKSSQARKKPPPGLHVLICFSKSPIS